MKGERRRPSGRHHPPLLTVKNQHRPPRKAKITTFLEHVIKFLKAFSNSVRNTDHFDVKYFGSGTNQAGYLMEMEYNEKTTNVKNFKSEVDKNIRSLILVRFPKKPYYLSC